jgi:RNA polymerase-binding protein DksA
VKPATAKAVKPATAKAVKPATAKAVKTVKEAPAKAAPSGVGKAAKASAKAATSAPPAKAPVVAPNRAPGKAAVAKVAGVKASAKAAAAVPAAKATPNRPAVGYSAAVKPTMAKATAAKATAVPKAATKAAAVTPPARTSAPAASQPAAKQPVEQQVAVVGIPAIGFGTSIAVDDDPWQPAELAEIRAELDAEVQRLRGEIFASESDLADRLRDGGDSAGDDQADAGTKTFEREHEMSLANNARDLLQQTEHAIDRIDSGTYGRCENCGNPIGKLRLQANPRATLCVSCKQREERR